MSDIDKLRTSLFATLEALQDKTNPMDIERAKAVCEVSQVIINTAKAEVDFARVNGSVDSSFFKKPGMTNGRLPAPKNSDSALIENAGQLPEVEIEEALEGTSKSSSGGKLNVALAPNGQRIVTHKAA